MSLTELKIKNDALSISEKSRILNEWWEKLKTVMSGANYVELLAGRDRYLIVDGTQDQITYYGKPDRSFRFSSQWNWINEERAPGVIQCPTWKKDEKKITSTPQRRYHIAIYHNGVYHFICGERCDYGRWLWDVPNNINELIDRVQKRYFD